MKSNLYRLSLLGLLLAALNMNSAVADDIAHNKFNSGDIAVSFNDLNLNTMSGLDSLYMRVESAAHRVCGVENIRVSLDILRIQRACVSSSIDNAIGQIGNARLTALHRSRLIETGQS